MYKQLTILLALASGTFCSPLTHFYNRSGPSNSHAYEVKVINDTTFVTTNSDSQPVIMGGQNNYHANQQIFYINWITNDYPRNCTNVLTRNDYVITPGVGAHKFHSRRMKWNNARKVCEGEGGHLAIINSLTEESGLMTWMQSADTDEVWLGVHDLFSEGEWITVMGEPLEKTGYDKWTTLWVNEPDNYGGNQNCGVLMKSGGMDDVKCDMLHKFVCEIDLC